MNPYKMNLQMICVNKNNSVGQNLDCVAGSLGNAIRITERLIKNAKEKL